MLKISDTARRKIVTAIMVLSIAGLAGLLGWNVGYHEGTGVWPGGEVKAVVLPEVESNVTYAQVVDFVREDGKLLKEYGVGFNCVESALLMARGAHWKGIPAEVVRVRYGQKVDHLLLAVPTSDGEWQYIDPQTGTFMKVIIGGDFMGYKIIGVDILRLSWETVGGVEE